LTVAWELCKLIRYVNKKEEPDQYNTDSFSPLSGELAHSSSTTSDLHS